MAIKTEKTILEDISGNFLSNQDKVTYIGTDSAIRGIFKAVSVTLYEMWNEIVQAKRAVQIKTANNEDLEYLANLNGTTRGGATKSSVVLVFNGVKDTVIPIGTQVKTYSGIVYETKNELILGKNSDIQYKTAQSIGDIVEAESVETGISTRVEPNRLTQITGIPNVIATNPYPSIGGYDQESDETLRARVINRVNMLAQTTTAFYEAIATEWNNIVLKAKPIYTPENQGIILRVLKANTGDFTNLELLDLQAFVYDRQRAMTPVVCKNFDKKDIEISFTYYRDKTITAELVYSAVASSLADYVEQNLSSNLLTYSDLTKVLLTSAGITTIYFDTLIINGFHISDVPNDNSSGIKLNEYEIPRLARLSMTDQDGNAIGIYIQQDFIKISS